MERDYLTGRVEQHGKEIEDLKRGYHNLDTRVTVGERDRERMTEEQKSLKQDNEVLKKGVESIDKRLFQIITIATAAGAFAIASSLGIVEAIKVLF